VAGFSGCSLHAVPDAAFEDDTGADAGAQGIHAERIGGEGAAGTEEAFAVGGEVGIGVDLDGAAETGLEFGAEVESVEAGKIGRMVEDAEWELEGSGAANADAEEVAGLLVDELEDGSGHIVEDRLGACAEAGGKADGVEALAFRCDGGNTEVGASEVHTNGKGMHGEW
jgi:hypothetical protein